MKKYLGLLSLLLVGTVSYGVYVQPPYPFANGGTGQTTRQAAINALAGSQTAANFLRGNGANILMSTIQGGDLPASSTAVTSLSNLATVGTVTSGTWQGTAVTVPFGGTGVSSFTASLPLIGNGAGAVAQGTVSGNTTKFVTTTGALTSTHCVNIDASGNFVDSGSTCGGGGGGSLSSATKTSNYTLTNSDDVILADVTGGSFTITLHASASATIKAYRIKILGDGTNTLTIARTGSDLIDQETSQTLTANLSAVTLIPDGGTNWYVQ